MKVLNNKLFSYVAAIILALTGLFQAIDKNSLAIFPFICALFLFVRAMRMNDK